MSGVAHGYALREPPGPATLDVFACQIRLRLRVRTRLRTPIPQTLYFAGCTAEYKQLQSPEAETPNASLSVF